MNYEQLYSLFERCMEEVDHVPPEHRSRLIEVAEGLLRLAQNAACEMPKPNAPTIHRLQ